MKKANGSYRMCIDFRKVNQVTSPQHHPLVSVAEVVDVFGEKKPRIFSIIDMVSRYHQVKVAEDSKKFTGFITPDSEHLRLIDSVSGYVTPYNTLRVPFKGHFNITSIDIVRSILMTSSTFQRM